MESRDEQRDAEQADQLCTALLATLNTFVQSDETSLAVIEEGCGMFFAEVLAENSVENGRSLAQIDAWLPSRFQTLRGRVLEVVLALWRERLQSPPAEDGSSV